MNSINVAPQTISEAVINSHKKVEGFRLAHRRKELLARRKRAKIAQIFTNVVLMFVMIVAVSQAPAIIKSAEVNQFISMQQEYEVQEFLVKTGDTAWDIQKKLVTGENMNKLMHHLPKLNEGQEPGSLQVGQTYKFFVEKEGN